MRSRAAAWLPWAVAGALLGVSLVTCAFRLAEDYHGLLDVALAVTCFWGITRHYRGPKLRPGERVVSAEAYAADQRLFTEMLALTHEQGCTGHREVPSRDLRAV